MRHQGAIVIIAWITKLTVVPELLEAVMEACAKPAGIVANFGARPGSVVQYDEANVVALVDLALAVPTRRGDYPGRCSRAIERGFAAAIRRIEGA